VCTPSAMTALPPEARTNDGSRVMTAGTGGDGPSVPVR
jgi:hypothetical protein